MEKCVKNWLILLIKYRIHNIEESKMGRLIVGDIPQEKTPFFIIET